MISMKEIGKLCGISESAVSKALRNHPGIKEETKQRVLEVAQKYGYQPNVMVECMQTGRSRSVGIAFNNFGCQFAGAIMRGIQQTLHKAQYDSYVICWDMMVNDNINIFDRFARRRVDGLLLFPMEHVPSQEHKIALQKFHNPIVLIDQSVGGLDFDYVGSDNVNGMRQLVEQLIKVDYERIGSVFYGEVSTGIERKNGFLAAMFEHNRPINSKFLLELSPTESDIYGKIRTLLAANERPEVLICFNDYIANTALNAALDLKLRVPEDLAITGFGNLPLCENLRPQLTSVEQYAEEIGRRAATLLLDRIEGRITGKAQQILIPTQVLPRNSTKKLK